MDEPAPGSVGEEDLLLVPIRMVEAVQYCPRQAWYRFVLADDPLNIHMERGLRRHATYGEAAPEASEGAVLARLVALNHERAAEERAGTVRWLRPAWQGAK